MEILVLVHLTLNHLEDSIHLHAPDDKGCYLHFTDNITGTTSTNGSFIGLIIVNIWYLKH